MKTISRRFCGALLGVCVLGLIVKSAGADEMADWMAEQRRQNDEYHRQWQQWWEDAARAAREAQEAQEARDRAYYEAERARAEQERARAEQEAWTKSQAEQRQWYEDQKRQQEWDDWWNNHWGSAYGGSADTSATSGQIWFKGRAASQSRVILNPFVLQQKSAEVQEKVRKAATELGQYIMPEGQALPQVIQNPFVGKPK